MSNKDLENYDTNEYHKKKLGNKSEDLLYEAEESENPIEIYQKIINSKDVKNNNNEIYYYLTLVLISIENLNIEEFENNLKKFLNKYSEMNEEYNNDDNKIVILSDKIKNIKSENKIKKLKLFQILENLLKENEFTIDYFYLGVEICHYYFNYKKDEEPKEKIKSIKEELDNDNDIGEEKDNIIYDLNDIEYDLGLDYEEEGINDLNNRDFHEAIKHFMKSYDIYLNLKKEDDALNILRYTFGASMLQDENDEYKLDTSPGLNYLINYFKNENIKELYKTHKNDFTYIMHKLTDNYNENDNMEKKIEKKVENKNKSSNSNKNSELGKLLENIKNDKDNNINEENEINNDNNESFEYYNENVNEFLEENKNKLEIDLLGFKLKESLSIVKEKIEELKHKIFDENLKKLDFSIITGRGNKSKRHQPILLPNITIYLKKRREFKVQADQGIIFVTIYNKY